MMFWHRNDYAIGLNIKYALNRSWFEQHCFEPWFIKVVNVTLNRRKQLIRGLSFELKSTCLGVSFLRPHREENMSLLFLKLRARITQHHAPYLFLIICLSTYTGSCFYNFVDWHMAPNVSVTMHVTLKFISSLISSVGWWVEN